MADSKVLISTEKVVSTTDTGSSNTDKPNAQLSIAKFKLQNPLNRPREHFYNIDVGFHEDIKENTNLEGLKLMAFGYVNAD